MAGNYIGTEITSKFKCKNGHSNEVKWSIFPRRGDRTARFAAEQEAFKRVRETFTKCPVCGASIAGVPKITWKDITD
jgi:hypothetical protein